MASMKEFSIFLDEITPCLESREEIDIITIRDKVNNLISYYNLNKSNLITKWIEINGNDAFKILQVTDVDSYFKVLNVVLMSSIEYLSVRNDPLYLLAQLSIMSDWYSYNSLDI